MGNTVTHLVYSHHHADHAGAADLFGNDLVRIGHQETRRLLLRDNDPTRPAPEVTFQDTYTLRVGGERVELAFHGPNHSPDNIFIHFPDHDALMLIDIVNSGWVPIYNCNLSEDIPGYIDAPATALTYPWKTYIGGHLGRLGTRDDIELHQAYIADIVESAHSALSTVDPTPYWANYGPNVWAAVKGYLDAVTDAATAPVVREVHRGAGRGGHRRVHEELDLHDHAVPAARPGCGVTGAPLTTRASATREQSTQVGHGAGKSLYAFSAPDSYVGNVGNVSGYINESGETTDPETVTWSQVRYTGLLPTGGGRHPGVSRRGSDPGGDRPRRVRRHHRRLRR